MIFSFFRFSLFALLILPVFILLFKISEIEVITDFSWVFIFLKSLLQAGLSASASLFFGFIGALGLLSMNSRTLLSRFFRTVAIIPGFVPQIIVLASVLSWTSWLAIDLRGILAVVFIHTLINSGICSVAIADLVSSKLAKMTMVCEVMGMGRVKYLKKILIPLLSADFLYLFMMIFAFCLTSFSIPLLVGDSQMSLEVLIYEKMKLSKDWGLAFVMSLAQILFILLLFYPLQKGASIPSGRGMHRFSYGSYWGLSIAILCTLLSCSGLLGNLYEGVIVWLSVADNFNLEFLAAFLGSLRITTMTTGIVFVFLNIIAFDICNSFFHRFLTGYLAPSPVIMGFSFWAFLPNGAWISEVKIAVSLSLIFLPALYRWKAASKNLSLRQQVLSAQVMGASRWLTFTQLIFPQTFSTALWLSGVAAFWASGDFALTLILGFGHQSLGVLAESLLASYQFGLASVISLVIFFMGSIYFFTLGAIGRVFDSKFVS